MVKTKGLILALLIFSIYFVEKVSGLTFEERVTKLDEKKTQQGRLSSIDIAESSIGVVTLNEEAYNESKFIRIYNQDGSLWYQFTLYYENSDGKFENENFKPFAFHPDYFVLVLKCVNEDANRYEVIVNEETGLKKFVRKDDPVLRFETWEQHILKRVFAVDFDRKSNPLREAPGGRKKVVELPKGVIFYPVEINGEWLKVRWSSPKKTGKNKRFGWIRWRENNKILIELFYFC